MQQIKCFEVKGNTDTTEGRGPMKVVARFSTYEAAVEYVKSPAYAEWCVMGYRSASDTNKISEVTLLILDSIDELEEGKKSAIRDRAIAKLTVEERKVLGL
jgi:ribosomal protein L20A (L18A)